MCGKYGDGRRRLLICSYPQLRLGWGSFASEEPQTPRWTVFAVLEGVWGVHGGVYNSCVCVCHIELRVDTARREKVPV